MIESGSNLFSINNLTYQNPTEIIQDGLQNIFDTTNPSKTFYDYSQTVDGIPFTGILNFPYNLGITPIFQQTLPPTQNFEQPFSTVCLCPACPRHPQPAPQIQQLELIEVPSPQSPTESVNPDLSPRGKRNRKRKLASSEASRAKRQKTNPSSKNKEKYTKFTSVSFNKDNLTPNPSPTSVVKNKQPPKYTPRFVQNNFIDGQRVTFTEIFRTE